jgi:hypothetical protein
MLEHENGSKIVDLRIFFVILSQVKIKGGRRRCGMKPSIALFLKSRGGILAMTCRFDVQVASTSAIVEVGRVGNMEIETRNRHPFQEEQTNFLLNLRAATAPSSSACPTLPHPHTPTPPTPPHPHTPHTPTPPHHHAPSQQLLKPAEPLSQSNAVECHPPTPRPQPPCVHPYHLIIKQTTSRFCLITAVLLPHLCSMISAHLRLHPPPASPPPPHHDVSRNPFTPASAD